MMISRQSKDRQMRCTHSEATKTATLIVRDGEDEFVFEPIRDLALIEPHCDPDGCGGVVMIDTDLLEGTPAARWVSTIDAVGPDFEVHYEDDGSVTFMVDTRDVRAEELV